MTHCTIPHPRHYVAMKLIAPLATALAISVLTAGIAGATTTPPPVLPNHQLTPGETDSRVTQSNIHQTICTRGYTKKVRPPESVTYPMKRFSMRQYGLHLPASDVEFDHDIPLELGGSSTPNNLWPQAYEHTGLVPRGQGSETKDRLEQYLNRQVCSGKMTLATAQREIATNWLIAAQQAGLTN